jgi:REP element-mobilizing transposase RayT
MPRPPRIEAPDALYHVTGRGVMKAAIVLDDHDRVRWIDYLREAVKRFGLELYAFALMDNHFHLFVAAPQANMGKAMQYINGAYAMYFNTRHERSGHLFERRYCAILIESQGHYTEVSRYIHLNPVRAGLVDRPEQYGWSSYPGYHSARFPLSWLNYERVLAEFADDPATKETRRLDFRKDAKWKVARERYREFVVEGVGKKLPPPWLHAIGGWIVGSPKFAAKTYALLAKDSKGDRFDSRAALGKTAIDASLDDIAQVVCGYFRITPDGLKELRARRSIPRAAFIYFARHAAGLSLKQIAAYCGIKSLGRITQVVDEMEKRISEDAELSRTINLIGRLIARN